MKNLAVERERHTSMLSPLKKEMLLSLLGLGAWRLYREGAHPTLVAEMFPIDAGHRELINAETIVTVLSMVADLPEYATTTRVERRIRTAVHGATDAAQAEFEFMHQQVYPHDPLLAGVLKGLAISDIPHSPLAKLATILIDLGNPGSEIHGDAYIAAMAGVWFELCDAALTVTHQASDVSS